MAEAAPSVASQWHPTKNAPDTPDDLPTSSNRRVWWQCQDGACGHTHEWQATVLSRVKLGRGCPVCSGRVACICNSLLALHPETIKAQWDPQRNLPLQPQQLKPQSNVRAHWVCDKHEPAFRWVARLCDRFGKRRTGCPECARLQLLTAAPASSAA